MCLEPGAPSLHEYTQDMCTCYQVKPSLLVMLRATLHCAFQLYTGFAFAIGLVILRAAVVLNCTQDLHLRLDASSVPKDYLITIYTQCFTFPHQIVFFLKASLQVCCCVALYFVKH